MGQTFTTAEKLVKRCRPGDLIEFDDPKARFNHWAVYVGEDEVIHLSRGEIRKELLVTAAMGRGVKISNLQHQYPVKDAEFIVRTAHEQLGMDWYNFQWYGCEQFVVRCRYGIKVKPTELHKHFEPPRKPTSGCTIVSVTNPMTLYGHQQHEDMNESDVSG